MFAVDEPAVVKQRMTAAVEWFNGHGRRTVKERSVFPLTNLNSTMTKPDISNKSDTSCSNKVPKSEGLPSAEQLENMFNKLGEDVSFSCRLFSHYINGKKIKTHHSIPTFVSTYYFFFKNVLILVAIIVQTNFGLFFVSSRINIRK